MERNIFGFTLEKLSMFLIESGLYILLSWAFLVKFVPSGIHFDELLWPVFWLNPKIAPTALLVIKGGMFMGPAMTFYRPTRWWGQILTFVCAFLFLSICYSDGKAYHSGRIFLIFMLCYLPLREILGTLRAAHLAYFVACLSYFNSGLWKVRLGVIHVLQGGDLSFLGTALQEHVAYASLERMKLPTLLGQWILESFGFSMILWVSVIVLELSPILLLWWPRYTFLFCIGYALFHLGAYWGLSISFLDTFFVQILLAAYFYLQRERLVSIFTLSTGWAQLWPKRT